MLNNRIEFYEPEGDYGWLTALSPHSVHVECIAWPTAEHYYQAQKFIDNKIQEELRSIQNPKEVKKRSREFKEQGLARGDWQDIKVDVMLKIQRLKFDQYPELSKKLCETVSLDLVEVSSMDVFWGWNEKSGGENMFGKIVMQVRAELLKA